MALSVIPSEPVIRRDPTGFGEFSTVRLGDRVETVFFYTDDEALTVSISYVGADEVDLTAVQAKHIREFYGWDVI